jgi:predicted nuclease of predicted toxin-antitoxin system
VKLLADEGVDRQIVDRLRQDDHQVWYVVEMERGISDDIVLDLANRESALLVTADKDFGELVYRQGDLTSGVILLRLAGLTPASKARIVASVINKYASELPRAFAVVTPGGIRIRRPRGRE